MITMLSLSWVEVDTDALKHNIDLLKGRTKDDVLFAPCVKGNAYGHGIELVAKTFVDAGADWLCVVSLEEALTLRNANIECPILIMGYVPEASLSLVVEHDLRVICYNRSALIKLDEAAKAMDTVAKIHVKAETGNNRQGLRERELLKFCLEAQKRKNIEIEGIFTHFANIEDTTDHTFAKSQFHELQRLVSLLSDNGVIIPIQHCANSAATLLFKNVQMNMVRPGIATYGMWPSTETYVAYLKEHGEQESNLKPALTWKTRIAQIRDVPAGEYIGYGCTYKTTHASKIAILPIGYYDGYDRKLSNQAYVLIKGKRAPLRGRVCMNMMMVDVTDVPEAKVEDEVILLGGHGDETISAKLFASWAGTINYEVTTRIRENLPRKAV